MKMLEFRRLTIADFECVNSYFQMRHTKNCEGQAVCAYIWKDYYQTSIAVYKDCLFLMEELDGRHFAWVPLCKPEKMLTAVSFMQEYFEQVLKEPFTMYCLDEADAKRISEDYLVRNNLELIETEDYADYIYDAEKLRTLSGKKLHKKKNHWNAFQKLYAGRWEYRHLSERDADMVLAYWEEWNELKHREDEKQTLAYERKGMEDVIHNLSVVNARMGGIFIDGNLRAYAIGSYNASKQIAYVHIEKADASVRGLYPMINQQFLLQEYPNALYVNREDDMGLESLRKAKMSYYPVERGRKFMLRDR